MPRGQQGRVVSPDNVHSSAVWHKQEESVDALSMPMSLLAMLFSMLSIFLKYRFLSWQAVVCAVAHLSTMKMKDYDLKQLLSTCGIALLSLVMAYVGPSAAHFR
ncbi:hypothetical protein Pelo_14208 [Pelomyxa schiedti]|nr:hypothetical protein Pelo_14208 [Pelomyxa schiedti]